MSNDFVSLSELKARGWTGAMIRDFLGEPDRTKPNPNYRNAAPMKLYAIDRIEKAEHSPEFGAAHEKARSQSDRARMTAKHRAKALAEVVAAIEIKVHRLDRPELLQRAIGHYNSLPRSQRLDRFATQESDPLFLERIMVNFIRHELTSYDSMIEQLYARVGRQEAYEILKRRTLEAIAATYPELASEALRQSQT